MVMVDVPAGPLDWRRWDAQAWGMALLAHYFVADDGETVSRLAISNEELAKAAGASEADAAPTRDSFLAAVRCSPADFRTHLSAKQSAAHQLMVRIGVAKDSDPPPYIPYLFFTCFAAASLDADTVKEGDFRQRVRQLLGHEPGTSYLLSDLSQLWEDFAAWLRARRDAGETYRILCLPERGRMIRIGYSVRLAFPRRMDRLRLRSALAAVHFGSALTVPDVFLALTGVRFSTDFQHVLGRARIALASGRDSAELQAVWSAALEVMAVLPQGRGSGQLRCQLCAQEDEFGRLDPFLVTDGTTEDIGGSVHLSPLDEPIDRFDHVLCGDAGGARGGAIRLFRDVSPEGLSGLDTSTIRRAIQDGVLLFQAVDNVVWAFTATRPTDGRVRALVRATVCEEFLSLVSGGPPTSNSSLPGWREVGQFDATELLELPVGATSGLASIRCLQRVEIGPRLRLVGGIRLDGGYLGANEFLPQVHCANAAHAESATIAQGNDTHGESPAIAPLEPVHGRSGAFCWPTTAGDLLGSHIVAGVSSGRVVASRRVTFHTRALRYDYLPPTSLERWLVEGCVPDVVPPTAGDAYLTDSLEGESSRPLRLDDAQAEVVSVFTAHTVEDRQFDRAIEALAALAASRRGLGEGELADILEKTISYAADFPRWSVIRAWLEAGYLDCFTRRHWRGRVYFARRPRFIVVAEEGLDGATRVVLQGLAPYRLRSVVRRALSGGGGTLLGPASLSQFVPPPLSWAFQSLKDARRAMAKVTDLDSSGVLRAEDLAGDFDAAVTDCVPEPPGYECQRVWNWQAGGFRSVGGPSSADGVRIEYLTRPDGPDRYVVAHEGRRRVTLSRTWALLEGFRCAGVKVFSPFGPRALVRQGEDGPLVPLPIARSISLRAGVPGGPVHTVQGRWQYAYLTEGASQQRWLSKWLSGGGALDATLARRLAWLCAAAPAPGSDRIPLPVDLRRRLRQLNLLPDALSIVEARINRRLLPHVRRTLDLGKG